MRILLLAPGVRAPWTEGRKNLVRDLQSELARRGFDVALIAGDSKKSGLWVLLSALNQCLSQLRQSSPDLLLFFPFGRFRGFRGAANIAFALAARGMGAIARIRMLTVLYSADGLALQLLRRLFGRLAAVGRHANQVDFIHLGASDEMIQWTGGDGATPCLLFLCGYQEGNEKSVKGVLEERGFGLLIGALSRLEVPVNLTVAIPFLRHGFARSALTRAAAEAKGVNIRWEADMDPRSALTEHDVFVFPYRGAHEVFVPTSMLEAMTIGIPVVATDLPMYRELTCPEGVAGCFLSAPDDEAALAAAIKQCVSNRARAISMAERQRRYVQRYWNISQAADDLLIAAGIRQPAN